MAQSSGSFTIGGTSPDYATIQLWDDDAATTLTGILEGKCRPVTFDENVTIGGSTSTASNYKKLTYDTGAFHFGVFGAGPVVNPAATKLGHVFTLGEDYARVVGIEVTDWQGGSSEAFRVGTGTEGNFCRIEQVLAHGAADINADAIYIGIANLTTYISNTFIGWMGRCGVMIQGTSANGHVTYVYNCTAVYCGSMDSVDTGAFSTDIDDPPDSGTWHIKNSYGHVNPSVTTGGGPQAFQKVAAQSWGNSTHNASSDATAEDTNGTNFENNAAVEDQLVRALGMYRVGENAADDYSGSWEDSWMNTGAQTTNYGTDVGMDIDNADRNAIFRCKMDLVPSATRLKFASVLFEVNDVEGFQSEWFKVLRNWVEAEITWQEWSSGNEWDVYGARGANDIYDDATYGGLSGVAGLRSHSMSAADVSVGEYFRTTGGALFTKYVQSAIDGSSDAGKGGDWIDVMWDWLAGSTTVLSVDSSEDSDGERPYIELYYDTENDPFDFRPVAGGVLDGNGTNLASDGDYPISIDLAGVTRDGTWDIGCLRFAEDTDVRATQIVAEIVRSGGEDIRASQIVAEIVRSGGEAIRATQILAEIAYAPTLGQDRLGAASLLADATLTAKPTRELPSAIAQLFAGIGYKSLNESFDVEDVLASYVDWHWYRGSDYPTYHTVSRQGRYVWPNGRWHDDIVYDSTYPKQIDQWPSGVATVTANDTTAPDGTTTADKLEDDSVTARENKGVVAVNVPDGAWVLHTAALKKQVAVSNNVYFEHGSYGGPFPGICIDPVTGEFSTSSHEWATVIDHPLDPDNWWFMASMYINSSGQDRSITTHVSPALNDNEPVNAAEEVTATGICHVWNVGITVIDVAADRPWGGQRAGIRIDVVDDTSSAGGGMHHYGVHMNMGITYDGAILMRAKIRGSAVPIGVRLVRQIDSAWEWGDPTQDQRVTVIGTGQWQDVFAILPPRDQGAATTDVNCRVGIHDDGTPVVGNFCEIDQVEFHQVAVSTVEHSAALSITGTATIVVAASAAHSAASVLSALAAVVPAAAVEHVASAAITGVAALYAEGYPVVWLRPDGDITVTNFEDEGGGTTDLYQKIDETVRSDADYIRSSGGSGTYECSLTTVGVPTPDVYHALEYAVRRGPDVLGTDLDMEFMVLQGSTVIASWTEVAISNQAWEGRSRYLTDEQVANITDYGDLRLRVVVGPSQKLLTYFPGDAVGTFTRTGTAWYQSRGVN